MQARAEYIETKEITAMLSMSVTETARLEKTYFSCIGNILPLTAAF